MASKIVSNKPNLPILNNLLLTADGSNTLLIESSNLELSIRLKIPAKVTQTGQVTIPAKKFAEYVNVVKEEKLDLQLEGNQLIVQGENNKTSFVTMPSSDFPSLPEKGSSSGDTISVDSVIFRNLIKRTVFASSSRPDQPVLNGVLFEISANALSAVSSDSFRLSIVTEPIESPFEKSTIIPAKALTEVDRLIADFPSTEDDEKHSVNLEFSSDDNQIFFQLGNVEIISRLLEAEFPAYQKIIPEQFTTEANYETHDLIDAIKTTSIFSTKEGQLVRFSLQQEVGKTMLKAQNSDIGSHSGMVLSKIEGEDIEIGFNSRYIVEGLGSFGGSEITLKLSGPGGAASIQSSVDDQTEAKYQHIIMPMDLDGV